MRTRSQLLLLVMICGIVTFVHAASFSAGTQITVVIREQQEFVQTGSTMQLKVRLAPAVAAKVWRDDRCGSPTDNALAITHSGVYAFPIEIIEGHDSGYYCLLSDDGQLRASVQIQ